MSQRLCRRRQVYWSYLAAALLLQGMAFAAETAPVDLENLLVKPQYYDIFYGQDDTIHLTGIWKFKPVVNVLVEKSDGIYPAESVADPEKDAGLTEGYFKPDFADADWQALPVPWCWNEPLKATSRDEPKYVPFAGVGYFRKSFPLPELPVGKRAFLHFASVQTACRVWVNGAEVGRHVNGQPDSGPNWTVEERQWLDDFEFEVTQQLRPGAENVIALRVYDDGQPILWKRYLDGGGICGPVTLELREPVYAPEIQIDPNIQTGEIQVSVALRNLEKEARKVLLRVEVEPFKSEFYTPPAAAPRAGGDLGQVECPPGEIRRQFALTVPEHKLWDVRQPFLYRLCLLADGRPIGQVRFGFRQFEVRGKQFYLNGSPLRILGTNPEPDWNHRPQIYCFNKGNALRLALRLFKEVNLNFTRVHNGPATQIFYDICDELGLLVQNDFSPRYSSLKPEDITRAEMIAQAHVGNYVGPDGQLVPTFQAELRKWLSLMYNHPANCSFTAGNELGHNWNKRAASEKQMANYIDGFYDFLKKYDRQHRPVTPSSGLAIWEWRETVKADFLDHHTYIDGEDGWADSETGNYKCIRDWERIYGRSLAEIDKPVIVGEIAGYQTRSCFSAARKLDLFPSGQLDKARYVAWLNRVAGEQKKAIGYWDWNVQRWYTRWAGVRSLSSLERMSQATATLNAHMACLLRRDMDFYQGFHLQDFASRNFDFNCENYAADETELQRMYTAAHEHVEFTAMQRMLAPRLVCLDMYDRHWFAGDTFQTDLHVANDYFGDDGRGYTAKLNLENPAGQALSATECAFDSVPPAGNAQKPVALALAADLPGGEYRLRVQLFKAGEIVGEQVYPLLVRRRADLPAVKSSKRVALYDTSETVFRGLGAAATRLVLEDLDVAYALVHDLARLDGFDVLVIGANSFDQNLQNQAEALRVWLEKGGRIVCFEQVYAGPVPFLSELRLQFCGNVFKADPIEPEHPAVRATDEWQWELWNGRREKLDGAWDAGGKRIYDTYLLPLTEGVVVAGGPRGGGWTRNLVFGMVTAEAKLGAGLVFFSQALATGRYGQDPVATRYLRDVLAYTLGEEWTDRYAAPVTGEKVTFLDRNQCFFVDLRENANRGFADDVDGDQKGGWTDQGVNDLRRIPRGDVTFMGVPYRILDDVAGGTTCVVLAGQHRPYFPAECVGIKVGRAAAKLAFLHAVAWGKEQESVGQYRVHYADGATVEIPLQLGREIGGWWSPADATAARVAWAAINPAGALAGLYTYFWTNPHPEKPIATIDFVSASADAVPALVAITGVI